jgi:hypothetical protein
MEITKKKKRKIDEQDRVLRLLLESCIEHLFSSEDVLRTSVPTSRFALCGHDFLHFYLIGIWYFFFEVYYYIPVTFSII